MIKLKSQNTMRYYLLLTLTLLLFTYEIKAFPSRYHTYGEMVDELNYLRIRYPHIVKVYTIGYSQTFNLPILALKVTKDPEEEKDKPRVLFLGVHHASEILGCEMCLYIANKLTGDYAIDPLTKRLVDSLEIWIVPIVNPDGHYITELRLDTLWRKNLRDNNGNGQIDLEFDGVDLNRNYDFLFELGGSGEPSNRYYRGPYPFSESEVRAVANLASNKQFILAVSFHSDMDPRRGETVYYPWRWGNHFCPDYSHIKAVSDSFAKKIINDANNGTYLSIFGRAEEGGLERNYLYYAFGTFALLCELWRGYYPPEERVDTICEKAYVGVKYLKERILNSHLSVKVVDSLTSQPIRCEVRILEAYAPPETIRPRFTCSTFGRARRILNPGHYTLQIIKNGYETKTLPITIYPNQRTEITVFLKPTGVKEEKKRSFRSSFRFPSIVREFQLEKEIKLFNSYGQKVDFRTLKKGVYFFQFEGRIYRITKI